MKNEILVAVDGSKHSSKVVETACELAKKFSTGILLVTVIQVPPEEPSGLQEFEKVEQYPDAFSDYLRDLSEKITNKYIEIIKNTGIPVRAATPSGHPAEAILQVADTEKPIMIVVGLKGLHGLARFRSLGSVARHIVEYSIVPVMVVPAAANVS